MNFFSKPVSPNSTRVKNKNVPLTNNSSSANLILATSTTPLQHSCPVFTSEKQNSPYNLILKANFVGFPAAPEVATFYNVVNTAKIPDYKVPAHSFIDEAPKRDADMEGLASPFFGT